MANNDRLHNSIFLSNHYHLLELRIIGSKAIVELLQNISLENYPTAKLRDCLRVLEAQLDEAIECARNCGKALGEYSQTLNSD